jgi:hypothetical protein
MDPKKGKIMELVSKKLVSMAIQIYQRLHEKELKEV